MPAPKVRPTAAATMPAAQNAAVMAMIVRCADWGTNAPSAPSTNKAVTISVRICRIRSIMDWEPVYDASRRNHSRPMQCFETRDGGRMAQNRLYSMAKGCLRRGGGKAASISARSRTVSAISRAAAFSRTCAGSAAFGMQITCG